MLQKAVLLALALGISGSVFLGTGFCDEKAKDQKQVEKAIRKYQRLLENGKQAKALNLAEKTARTHPKHAAAKLLKQHSELLANSQSQPKPLAPAVSKASAEHDTQIVADFLIVDVPETFFERLGLDFEMVLPYAKRETIERIGIDFDFNTQETYPSVNAKPIGIDVRAIPQADPTEPPRIELVDAQEEEAHAILSPLEAHLFKRALQANCEVLSRPKVCTLPAQPAKIEVNSQDHKIELELIADLSQDGKHITMTIDGKCQDQEAQVEETLPLGKTMLMNLGTRVIEARSIQATPILSKVPYISRLYKNTGIAREVRHRLVLITPKVVKEPKSHPAQAPHRD